MRLRLRNTDEVIHNAPYGAKQPDEGEMVPIVARQPLLAPCKVPTAATRRSRRGSRYVLNPFVIFKAALRESQFILRFIDELCAEAFRAETCRNVGSLI